MAKGCSSNNYEEARKQRLEENKKRFEDLGISKISKKLAEIASPAKKSPNRLPKPRAKTLVVSEPRRSSRARNQITSYVEEFTTDLPHSSSYLRKRSRSSSSSWESYIARPLDEIKVATTQERNRAWAAAEALQIDLESSNPSFIKSMVRSHVYSCFWLGLPSRFCEEHLPKTVYNMVLEDENGSEYDAVYIGSRSGLSGGWRAFALEHKLDDGDALVFELVEAARFKIYIVRAFPNIDEEEEEENTLEEENMHTSKTAKGCKAANNRESESKKTKKKKLAIVCETKESESSEESLQDSDIDKEFKPRRVNPGRKTKTSQKNFEISEEPTTPEPKGELQIEIWKPKEAIKTTRSSQRLMKKISQVPTTPELKGEEQVEIMKPKEAIKATRSSQRKMQKTSEASTTPEPKGEPQIEMMKPKEGIKTTRSSQRLKQKISEVSTTPEPKGELQIEIWKPKEAIKATRSSRRKMQKISEVSTTPEPKVEEQVETLKPKEESNECEMDDSTNIEQLPLVDIGVETTDANLSKKKEHVQDDDIELMKDKPNEETNKRASQKPRKKSASKFFRKRA